MLPRPISALLLLLLLLELGGILVSLFNRAELVSPLLVIPGDVDDSLSSASFPGRVKSTYDVFNVAEFGLSAFRSEELDDRLHRLRGLCNDHHGLDFRRDVKTHFRQVVKMGHDLVHCRPWILEVRDPCF